MNFTIESISESDYDKLKQHALEIMPSEKYHNKNHAEKIESVVTTLLTQSQFSFSNYQYTLLSLAALYHDTGYSTGNAENHEQESCDIFMNEVNALHSNIPSKLCTDVCDCIMDTVLLEPCNTELGEYLADADVWSFGANWGTFFKKATNVRDEFAPDVSEEEWFRSRAHVLSLHDYQTDIGKQKYAIQKKQNKEQICGEYGPPIQDSFS